MNGASYTTPFEMLDDANRDLAIRTLFGEASSDPASQAAVAHVIRNRSNKAKASVKDIVLSPNQFEPWGSNKKKLLALDRNSPEYVGLGQIVDKVWAGTTPDPTGGATMFYAPKAQAALGRKPPSWETGKGLDIGQHRFFGGEFPTPKAGATIAAALGNPASAAPPAETAGSTIAASLGARPPTLPTKGGGFNPASLFQEEAADVAALAEAMEMSGLPDSHIAAVTGLSKRNGRWS